MRDDEFFFGRFFHEAPRSVFFRGKRKPRPLFCFRKTHETQRMLERERYRRESMQRMHDDEEDDDDDV
jgi:hypothetical protein